MRLAVWWFFLRWAVASAGAAAAVAAASAPTAASASAAPPKVDEQLYSRQIFVYGKSAQQSLSTSRVVVHGDHAALKAEIVKNLALAGVGKLIIVGAAAARADVGGSHHRRCSLTGGQSLAEYARSLNRQVDVEDVPADWEAPADGPDAPTVAVCAEHTLTALAARCTHSRGRGVKSVGCAVRGVCGLVCDDFLAGFSVVDGDGEFYREIPLKDAVAVTHPAPGGAAAGAGAVALRLTSIEEERLGLGDDDIVELTVAAGPSPGDGDGNGNGNGNDSDSGAVSVAARVLSVGNTRSAVVEVAAAALPSGGAAAIVRAAERGGVTAKKGKQTLTIDHRPLAPQLLPAAVAEGKTVDGPSFVACNGCLSDKKDRALSATLLAAFRASESPTHAGTTVGPGGLAAFRRGVLRELTAMGYGEEPSRPLKQGGVGQV